MTRLEAFFYSQQQNINTHAFNSLVNAIDINKIKAHSLGPDALNALVHERTDIAFVNQSRLPEDEFYESFIYRTGQIPTREDNWHDFFNGAIWLQYPQTKTWLNRLHVEHIAKNGLHPRGAVRDRITHFDECGVVIFWSGQDPSDLIKQHCWQSLFVEHRQHWHSRWKPIVFGHAIYEMLLSPFIGLTAKVICIEVPSDNEPLSLQEQDTLIVEYLQNQHVFQHSKRMSPLPLLGVPGWHIDVQDSAFYANQNYFMPKKSRALEIKQD